MRVRGFHKRVEIWQNESVFDGVSGYINTPIMIATVWAKIETINNRRLGNLASDLGIEDRNNTIIITLRKRDDITYNSINQFVKYGGFIYNIQTEPINTDFDNSYVMLFATRQDADDVGVVTPKDEPQVVYTNYVNYSLNNGAVSTNDVCLKDYVYSLF